MLIGRAGFSGKTWNSRSTELLRLRPQRSRRGSPRGGLPVAPLHAFRASTPSTGKSLLVDVAATIATGRPCPVIAAGKDAEETEKRLGALLRDGVPIISIDNVEGELGGTML